MRYLTARRVTVTLNAVGVALLTADGTGLDGIAVGDTVGSNNGSLAVAVTGTLNLLLTHRVALGALKNLKSAKTYVRSSYLNKLTLTAERRLMIKGGVGAADTALAVAVAIVLTGGRIGVFYKFGYVSERINVVVVYVRAVHTVVFGRAAYCTGGCVYCLFIAMSGGRKCLVFAILTVNALILNVSVISAGGGLCFTDGCDMSFRFKNHGMLVAVTSAAVSYV